MLTILCVMKSGGAYDAEWVRRLHDGVKRHMAGEYRFACLSDVDVPCERIRLRHDWPGWWSKIELFAPWVVNGPTLYMDLDTVVTGDLSKVSDWPYDFAMLKSFNEPGMVGSGLMWFAKPMTHVYDTFAKGPEKIMTFYKASSQGCYVGDQAFIWDCMEREVPKIAGPSIRSYKQHCRLGLPKDTSVVCFHGRPRPNEINAPWIKEHWA